MYDLAAINRDQLITASDRLLIRGGLARRRSAPTARLPVAADRCPAVRQRPSLRWLLVSHAALIGSVFSVTAMIVAVV